MDSKILVFTCRGCLSVETKAVLHSLENDTVRDLFTKCTEVPVSLHRPFPIQLSSYYLSSQIYLEETNLPMQICSLCFGRCENWDSFRSRCQANNDQLRAQCPEVEWESDEEKEQEDEVYIKPVPCKMESEEQEETEEYFEQEQETIAQDYQIIIETEDMAEETTPIEEDVKPQDVKFNDSKSNILICEECGLHVKGLLALRKHSFQHANNIHKPVKNVKRLPQPVDEEAKRLVSSWTMKSRKKLKAAGEAYINSTAKLVPKRQVKPGCLPTCPYKCHENFTDQERQQLFQAYWAMSFGDQREFCHENVTEKKCNRTLAEGGRRKYTLIYSFLGKRTCKTFFCDTLDISDRVVAVCKTKARQSLDVSRDYRGAKKKKVKEEEPYSSIEANQDSGTTELINQ